MVKHQSVNRLAVLVGLLAVTLLLCAAIVAPTGYDAPDYGRVSMRPNWLRVSIAAGIAFVIGSGSVRVVAWIADGLRRRPN